MHRFFNILILIGLLAIQSVAQDSTSTVQTSLLFKGQLSTWAHFNPDNAYPLYLGGRYIPQLNYEVQFPQSKLLDFEASANIYGDVGIHFFDSATTNGDVSPYRIWARYSTDRKSVV